MLAAGLMYAGLIVVFTWPMMSRFQTSIVGGGDAFHALWSFWWFEQAIAHPLSIWDCPLLLHPYGADLIQHDYFLWPNVLALVTRRLGLTLVGSYNGSLWLAIWLNALSMFLLARAVLKEWLPAFVGGLAFAFAPFFWGRVQGHLGFMHAYPLPLFALCLYKAQQTRSRRWAMGAGGSWVLAALSQYSYAIYAGAYWILWSLYHQCPFSLKIEKRASPRWRWAALFLGIGVVAAAIAVAVSLGGGREIVLGGVTIRIMRSGRPLTVCCLSWLLAFLLRHRLIVARRSHPPDALSEDQVRLWGAMALPLILLLPILARGVRLILAGDYAAPYRGMRSGFMGAYAISALLPNIYHSLWGGAIQEGLRSWSLLERGSIGLGWTAIGIVLGTRAQRLARWWTVAFAAFFLLSLGPFLEVYPRLDHGPVLPYWLLSYLPLVSAARVPLRWIVMGLLAWCVLVALGFQRIRSAKWRALAFAGILFEGMAVPLPMTAADIPQIYRTIGLDRAGGAVLELPFGVRDGRRVWGYLFPPERLYYQTVHQKPLVGGYISGIPDRIFSLYEDQPILRRLVALQTAPDRAQSIPRDEFVKWSGEWGITWVILDRDLAAASLAQEIQRLLGAPLLEGGRLAAWKIP
jgi:hypothetical protein